jgi:hypothetical protein
MQDGSKATYNAAVLFVQKWDAKQPDISAWFDDEYLKFRQTFYAASTPPGVPSTNNPEETFHARLKQFGTQRQRLTVGQFLSTMAEELHHLSHPREMGGPFPECPKMVLEDWRHAQLWLQKVGVGSILKDKKDVTFMVPSSSFLITNPGVAELKAQAKRWNQKDTPIAGETFDTYTSRRSSMFQLKKLSGNSVLSPNLLLSCTCPMYLKRHKCKHCIGVAIGLNLLTVPVTMSLERIAARNSDGSLKRGRKPNAPKQQT